LNISDLINENKDFDFKRYDKSRAIGVYFICENDGSIIYIGSTVDLDSRLRYHSIRKEFNNKPMFFFNTTKNKRKKIEKILIEEIKPEYNIQWTVPSPQPRKPYIINTEVRRLKKKDANDIRKKVKDAMAEQNITQSDLTKIMEISKQRVSQIIHGDEGFQQRTINKLQKALGFRE